jgi:poly(3-hydroxybutyrate) depolymerase
MPLIRVIPATLLLTLTLVAQAPQPNPEAGPQSPEARAASMAALMEQQPDVQGLGAIVRTLSGVARVAGDVKAQADKLNAEAAPYQTAGDTGKARRRMVHAIALLLGKPWGRTEEYGASLVMRTPLVVADPSGRLLAHLAQSYPARHQASKGLRLRVSLTEAAPRRAIDLVVPAGGQVRELGTFEVPSRDLIDEPFYFDASLEGIPEGACLITAEIRDGEVLIARLATPIYLVRDIAAQRAAIERKLARIQGHESTKATIRYPFNLADGLNARRREVTTFDFPKALRRSADLVKALEAGQDPLFRAGGDQRRNYWFAEAGEIMPYRLYVPTAWDGKKKLPLVVALHGSNTDENLFLERGGGILRKLAEEHGYIVASPLGYRINGGYGNVFRPSMPAGAPPDPARMRMAELSEKDVLNVTELVASEYGVDRSRMYLMGISMGGGGTWRLGAKYAERWAAIAPASSSIRAADYPYDRLKGLPVIFVTGDLDPLVPVGSARALAAQFKERGLDMEYVEITGGTHPTAVEIAMPKIFDFFNRHRAR